MHLQRDPRASIDTAVERVGPSEERQGIWARKIDWRGRIVLRFDRNFARNLQGKTVIVDVTYFDEGSNKFTLSWDENGKKRDHTVAKGNTLKWRTESIRIDKAAFSSQLDGADMFLTGDKDNVFHMVEVRKEDI